MTPPSIIKLDFDHKNRKKIINAFDMRIFDILAIVPINIDVKETMHGYHIILQAANELTDHDIVFIQLALGSDIMRELFNWRRVTKTKELLWNTLYCKKFKNGKLYGEEKYTFRSAYLLNKLVKKWREHEKKKQGITAGDT